MTKTVTRLFVMKERHVVENLTSFRLRSDGPILATRKQEERQIKPKGERYVG